MRIKNKLKIKNNFFFIFIEENKIEIGIKNVKTNRKPKALDLDPVSTSR